MINQVLNQVVQDAEKLIRDLKSEVPERDSTKWYAINNLKTFCDALRGSEGKEDIVFAGRMLSRFATDSLDWGSDLLKQFESLAKDSRKAARMI